MRRAGVAVICAKVLLVPLAFDPRAFIAFSQPKALVAYALGALLSGLLVAYVVRYGRGAHLIGTAHAPVAIFVAAACLATVVALDHTVALYGAHDRNLGLLTIVDNAVLYVSAVTFVRTRWAVLAVMTALFAAPVPVMLYQAVQMSGNDPLPWASGFVQTRPFSTFGNAGSLAQYLGTLAAAAGMLALTASHVIGRQLSVVLGLAAMIMASAAVLTGTRAVLLGLAAGGAVVLGHLIFRAPTAAARRWAIVGAVAALVVGGAAVLLTPSGRSLQAVLVSAPSITSDPAGSGEGSVGGRLVIYQVALAEVRERPLLGVGPDNFVAAFGRHRPAAAGAVLGSDAPQTSAHSWLAHVATSAGLLGLAAFLAMLGFATLRAARQGMPPPAAAGLAAATSFLATGLVSINDVGTEWLLWLSIAGMATPMITVAPTLRSTTSAKRRRKRPSPSGNGWRTTAGGVAIALGVLLAISATRAHGAAVAAEEARQARGRGDPDAARVASQRATSLDPERAAYWTGLGLALGGAGRPGDAVPAFTKAAQLAPYQAGYQANLARALVARGDAASRTLALGAARKAVEVDPNIGEPHFVLALALMANGDPAAAAVESERGLALQPVPRDRFAAEVAGRAYFELGKMSESERWLRLAISQSPGRDGADARLLLARVLAQTSRLAEALEQVNAVLALDPSNQQAARLRVELGQR